MCSYSNKKYVTHCQGITVGLKQKGSLIQDRILKQTGTAEDEKKLQGFMQQAILQCFLPARSPPHVLTVASKIREKKYGGRKDSLQICI